MIENPRQIIEDFVLAVQKACGKSIAPHEITHECLVAPHDSKNLPAGKGAVYVFTLSQSSKSVAGPNRALKVGKAGPNSNARFRYQHYRSGSAKSTLAGAIENNPILHSYIGLDRAPADIGAWIRQNTDRDNFYVDADRKDILSMLELYLKGRLGPVFEGSLSASST